MVISLLIAAASSLYSGNVPECVTFQEPVCVIQGVEDGTMSGRSQMIIGDRAYTIDGL